MRVTPSHFGQKRNGCAGIEVHVSRGNKTTAGGYGLGPVVDESEHQRYSRFNGGNRCQLTAGDDSDLWPYWW